MLSPSLPFAQPLLIAGEEGGAPVDVSFLGSRDC